MRVFITGICGFVGSNIANKLYDSGYDVCGCDNLQFGYIKNINSKIGWYHWDINQLSEEILNQYDVLIHCATSNIIYAQTNPLETFKTNAFDSIKLIEKFQGKIIYTSTSSIYGQANVFPTPETADENITNAYDQSKLILEKYLKIRGNYTTLRLSNVYGKNQRPENKYAGVVSVFANAILNDKPVLINGDGTDSRDYTEVNDVVIAVMLALETEMLNTEINIGTGVATTSLNLALKIAAQVNKTPTIKFIDKRSIDRIHSRQLDITKAKQLLGWQPSYNLEEGLKRTINWIRNENK